MSLSNPNNSLPNPATRWFDWNGESGSVSYFDRDSKSVKHVGLPFVFILLDELASIRGWHDPSQSGIYSNEIRDSREDRLLVKAFKGGVLADGLYRDIKDRISSMGGSFTTTCYLAYKGDDSNLAIGAIRFRGASLSAWMEFRRQHRRDFYSHAIQIGGFTEGKKGRIAFRTPNFACKSISEESIAIATALDRQLQNYLAEYLTRTRKDRVDDNTVPEKDPAELGATQPQTQWGEITDDDVPF